MLEEKFYRYSQFILFLILLSFPSAYSFKSSLNTLDISNNKEITSFNHHKPLLSFCLQFSTNVFTTNNPQNQIQTLWIEIRDFNYWQSK